MGEGGGDAQLDVKCELQTRCVVTRWGTHVGLLGMGYRTVRSQTMRDGCRTSTLGIPRRSSVEHS